MRRLIAAAAVAAVALALAGCGTSGDSTGSAGESAASTSTSPAGDPTALRGLTLEVPVPRPAFTLTDDGGATFDFATETAGRPTFLFFGYTTCPDICPTTMADVAVAIRELPADIAADVQVVFVTTDPATDTGPVLAEFLDHFDTDLPNGFIGLTGTVSEVEAAQRAAKVTVAQDMGRSHSAVMQLYGPDDLARVVYVGGSSPDDIAHDVPLIM